MAQFEAGANVVKHSLNPTGVYLEDAKGNAEDAKRYTLLVEYMELLKTHPETAKVLVNLTPEELVT